MNYQISRDGKIMGTFSLDEISLRRSTGELDGSEFAWRIGMPVWQPIDSILPKIPGPQRVRSNGLIFILIGLVGVLGLIGAVTIYFVAQHELGRIGLAINAEPFAELSAIEAASKPVEVGTNTWTAADLQKRGLEFRERQYVEGLRQRGDQNPNPKMQALALGLVQNWVACNFGGEVNTNLPSLTESGNQLAADPAGADPLVLTVAAITSAELHEANRRLERAVKGFENSRHRGYPKLFATVTLIEKIISDREDRLPVLDAKALQYFTQALADGSILPGDQAELGESLVQGWGKDFFKRNPEALIAAVEARGESMHWLALTLRGDNEINIAWAARGNGFAESVSSKGWDGFAAHLALARTALTQAWQLQPGQPLAPCLMINVSLGDASIGEMRRWFDRTVAAQIDYASAWSQMRWGLRPRWYGNREAQLAFGVTAINTHRFDTDVPRVFFDCALDVESDAHLPAGQRIFHYPDVWPHIAAMYEGYISNTKDPYTRDGWQSTYAAVAYLSQMDQVAAKQLDMLQWQPHEWCFTGWGVDLSLLSAEVEARTFGALHLEVVKAEEIRTVQKKPAESLAAFDRLANRPEVAGDKLTAAFIRDRQTTLGLELKLQAGDWVNYLPTDTNFTGWHIERGNFQVLPDGSLKVQADENGHLAYSRIKLGTEFEARGQFEMLQSSSASFQAGLVMGLPQFDSMNWYAFRIKRHSDEGDVASFSQHWSKRQILAPTRVEGRTNSFYFRFEKGLVTATVNGQEVFARVAPPKNSYVGTNEFLLGVGAFNDSNSTTIRYHDLQVRRLPN